MAYAGSYPLVRGNVRDGSYNSLIWLDDVQCRGTENRLIDCPAASPLGRNDCNHMFDAGILCSPTLPCDEEGAIRIQGGASQGRVEVCMNEIWGSVCSDLWNDINARVTCRQLGLPSTGKCDF